MKLDEFLDVPDTPRFCGLLFVMIIAFLAIGPLQRYIEKPEVLPPTVVPCRHFTVDSNGVIYAFGYYAGETVTNVSQIYWYGPTNHP